MVRVDPFNYPLETRLVEKLDLMIERCRSKKAKRDAVLLIEGAEGEGKSTCSVAVAYYVANKLNREFTHKNMFFDAVKMMEFLQSTEEQIAVWDEPALQALSTDFASKALKDLTRLLMMVRKKRHFIIINMTHFNKFNDYIVCTRPLGIIHVYSRKGTQAGRFLYIRRRFLENLWLDWKFKKQRNYVKYAMRSGKIMGCFPDVLSEDYANNVLSVFDVKSYEDDKDKAIQQVGKKESPLKGKDRHDLLKLKKTISFLKFPIKTQEDFCKYLGISSRSYLDWRLLDPLSAVGGEVESSSNNDGNKGDLSEQDSEEKPE
jgi:hypothetical protein